jgi:glycosyltransferase involved in cell wall biosynthesis
MAGSVLFVTRKWSPAPGGMETYSVELVAELSRRTDVETVALAGMPDGSTPSPAALAGFALRAAARYLARGRPPGVLHVGDMASWPLALVALARRPRPLIVLSAHGTDVSYHRRGGLRGTAYRCYLRLGARVLGPRARVIANSSATARAAAETGWHTHAIVPLGTGGEPATAPASGHDGPLLFAGRLIHQKGCRWFVEQVLPLLPEGIRLAVAGPVRDEREGPALADPRVEYLGSLPKEELRRAYRTALAVVVPNIEPLSGEFEGFGLVAAEAAAAGAIVIAANTGGLTEAVLDGETGFLVPPGDPEAWRALIAEIAGWSDDQRAAFTARATARAREHYSWARVADEVMRVYEGEG